MVQERRSGIDSPIGTSRQNQALRIKSSHLLKLDNVTRDAHSHSHFDSLLLTEAPNITSDISSRHISTQTFCQKLQQNCSRRWWAMSDHVVSSYRN